MREKLYHTNPIFAKSLEESDRYIQKELGRSLIEELYVNKNTSFDDLLITHPAIIAIELALWSALGEAGITPDYVSGSRYGHNEKPGIYKCLYPFWPIQSCFL